MLIACLGATVALALTGVAASKEIATTTCGKERCRTVLNGVTGVGVRPGRVAPPGTGRFYTIEMEGGYGWKVVYEARRGLVRAADFRARSFMGIRWARLTPDLRPQYAHAVRGLAPMRSAPPYRD